MLKTTKEMDMAINQNAMMKLTYESKINPGKWVTLLKLENGGFATVVDNQFPDLQLSADRCIMKDEKIVWSRHG